MTGPDIVTTLRREPFYHPTSRINSFGMPQMGFELTSFNLIAADEIERLRSERDEAIIHANNVVRESSSLITAKIPCGSCGGYWNAVDEFRRFESKTT